MDMKELEEKYGKEEVRKAEKRLRGETFIPSGSREETLENDIKQHRKTAHIDY